MSDSLLEELLAKPVGPEVAARKANPDKDFTSKLEVRGDQAVAELRREAGGTTNETGRAYLVERGLDPEEWEQTGYRRSEWTMANGEIGESARYTYRRIGNAGAAGSRPPLDELLAAIEPYQVVKPPPGRQKGDHGFLVLLGDMQFGKVDGDGAEGTLHRTIDCLNKAADRLMEYRDRFSIDHVHIAWLGDHVEGFQSQGGANVWRTSLTLTEQIRLVRRVMLHAMCLFAPLAPRLTMAAVPGNHGETVRFAGKGITRYDDSHDTESLVAVADAATLNPDLFGHVEFYVPENDEMTVVLDVAGTVIAHAHGHQWRTGKHMDWWQGQAFSAKSPMHHADLLVAGHLHHEHVDTDGPRTFIQVPAMESESTWFRHARGTTGAPGLIVAVTKNGQTDIKEVVR